MPFKKIKCLLAAWMVEFKGKTLKATSTYKH